MGAVYEHTLLREHDNLGVISPTFNAPCVDADGVAQPGLMRPIAVRSALDCELQRSPTSSRCCCRTI